MIILIKLSKSRLSKMVQLGGLLGNMGCFSDHLNVIGSLLNAIDTFEKVFIDHLRKQQKIF